MTPHMLGEHPCTGEGQLRCRTPMQLRVLGSRRFQLGIQLPQALGCLRSRLLHVDQQGLAVARCREIEAVDGTVRP